MKSVVVVVILAVVGYFLFKPTTFTVKNDIFMYKSPEDVYEFISDLKKTTEKHSTLGGKCTLLKHRTRKNGVKEKLFLVEKNIPLFWDYELPLNLETRLILTKPQEELQYEFAVLRGYLLKLHGRITVEKREGRAMPGSLLTEELTVTCPWLATTFVEKALGDSHKDTLVSMRNGIEATYIPQDRTKVEEEVSGGRKEDGKKMEKMKETSDDAGKTERTAKMDEKKKPSMSTGQEHKQAEDAAKKNERQAMNKKMKKTASKDADHRSKKAEKKEGKAKVTMDKDSEGRNDQDKSIEKMEKKKETTADDAIKKETTADDATQKDKEKKPSKSSGQEHKQAKDGTKKTERQTENEKMEKTVSKDAGHQSKTAEKTGETGWE